MWLRRIWVFPDSVQYEKDDKNKHDTSNNGCDVTTGGECTIVHALLKGSCVLLNDDCCC